MEQLQGRFIHRYLPPCDANHERDFLLLPRFLLIPLFPIKSFNLRRMVRERLIRWSPISVKWEFLIPTVECLFL